MTSLPARAGRRCHNALNPLHSTVYFSPDFTKELAGVGIEDSSAAYFAGRGAAMGAVGAGVITAAFYNFNHDLVARHVPEVWRTAPPEAVLAARLRAVDSTLRRLLGAQAVASDEMAEAAGLALRAAEACTRHARPLYAAHADLPVPEQPHLAYWHVSTLLREHRATVTWPRCSPRGSTRWRRWSATRRPARACRRAGFWRPAAGTVRTGKRPRNGCGSADSWTARAS